MAFSSLIPRPSPSFLSLAVYDGKLGEDLVMRLGFFYFPVSLFDIVVFQICFWVLSRSTGVGKKRDYLQLL